MKKSLIILAVLLAPICAWAQDEAKEPQKVAEAPTPTIVKVPGDVNNDGEVSGADVTLVVNSVLGILTDEAINNAVQNLGDSVKRVYFLKAADVNGDNQITGADVTIIVNKVLGIAN